MPASIHIGDGFARIGGVTLPARASARGLELGEGAVLRPVAFGLRSRLTAWSGDDLPEALLGEMLDGAVAGLESLALQALALHLAGADSGAPGFAASASLVARLLGWPLADINAAEALEIDRLAASLAPATDEADDGVWTTVLFTAADDASAEDEPLEALCARLIADLQRRGDATISPSEAAVLRASPAAAARFAAQHPASPTALRGVGGAAVSGSAGTGGCGDQSMPSMLDPPPDPWRDAGASIVRQPDFGARPSVSPPSARFAQPLSERGPDAAVWAQPDVDGDPALAYQAGQEPMPARHDQPEAFANPTPAATAPSPLPPQAQSQRSGEPVAFAVTSTRHPSPEGFAAPANRGGEPTPAAADTVAAPTRSSWFRQAAVSPDLASGQPDPVPGQPAPSIPLPMTRAAEPALDLDGIADALHAIADLRGVAR